MSFCAARFVRSERRLSGHHPGDRIWPKAAESETHSFHLPSPLGWIGLPRRTRWPVGLAVLGLPDLSSPRWSGSRDFQRLKAILPEDPLQRSRPWPDEARTLGCETSKRMGGTANVG
jgi:hypothetical protein